VVLSDLQPPRLRYFCPTSLCSSSSGVAIVSFQRLRKTEQRDHADDFRDPFFGSVLAQFREHIVGHRIGH
jgi:hypothetical protein